jgi:hypothetical protein
LKLVHKEAGSQIIIEFIFLTWNGCRDNSKSVVPFMTTNIYILNTNTIYRNDFAHVK